MALCRRSVTRRRLHLHRRRSSSSGNSAGFDVYLKDNKGQGHAALIAARNQLLGMASKDKLLANVRPNGQEDAPQFRLDIDAQKAASLGTCHGRRRQTLSRGLGRALHR